MVRKIRVEGNAGSFSGQNDFQVRGGLLTKQSPALAFIWPFNYLLDPSGLDPNVLSQDAWRAEIWYAHMGYFDARFAGWAIHRVKDPTDVAAGVVDIIGHVDPGPRSKVRNISLEGLNRATMTLGKAALNNASIQEGDFFDLASLQATQSAIYTALANHSRAYAQVDMVSEIFPEDLFADVTFTADAGRAAKFGEFSVSGLDKLPERVVLDSVWFASDETYSLEDLKEGQEDLFHLGMFSLVAIEPDLSDPSQERVPINFRVTETKFRKLRLGVGATYDSYTVAPELRAKYHDVNLFGSLLDFTATGSIGYNFAVAGQDDNGTVIWSLGGQLVYPWLVGRRLSVGVEGGVKQYVDAGRFPVFESGVALPLIYKFTRESSIRIAPNVEWVNYYDTTDADERALQRIYGTSFVNPYRRFAIDIGLTFDYRDDPIAPRRGTFWSLFLRQGIPFSARDFFFTKIEGDVRGYKPIRFSKRSRKFPIVLAGRLNATIVQPWAGRALPYKDLAFLGGANSLRGFRQDQVGPYDCLCSYQERADGRTVLRRRYLALGGTFSAQAMAEARVQVSGSSTFVVFGDVGLLARGWNDIAWDKIRGSGGVGWRIATPIGPIRLDVGFRPMNRDDYGPSNYIGCQSGDGIPRAFDLTSSTGTRREFPEFGFPLVTNVFLSIGEAF